MRRSSAQSFSLLVSGTNCSCCLIVMMIITQALLQQQPAAAQDGNGGVACKPHEREALLAFKRGITSDPKGLLASWQEGGEDCCRWRGVRCSKQSGHVLKLQLRNEDLDYYNYKPISPMVGQISRSLLLMVQLDHLDLSWNSLNGSSAGRIPEFLGSFKNLKYLNLSGIPFRGRVPPSLGNLSNLQYLDLSFMGDTHSTDVSWLACLPSLLYLDLSSVNLSTVADWANVVNMIPSLNVLYLCKCSLTSANQSLRHPNLQNLEELDLSYNSFDHPITSCWFWNITQLKTLYVSSTSLYGPFPSELQDMTSLHILDISQSDGKKKPKCIMTTSLRNHCSLEVLDISGNLLYGDIAELLELLPHCATNKLRELYLSGNNISGVLPNNMEQLTSLEVLYLGRNNISGVLPYEIGMLSNLTDLYLFDNALDGVITEQHFDNLKSLRHISLPRNSLKIEISSEWRPPFRLQGAHFAFCRMGPQFPSWLKWMVDIYFLDISNTGIDDCLPDWISSTFSNAWYLNFSNNHIHGRLPVNMEHMSLEQLSLASNQLTGPIPLMPVNLTTLDLSSNSLSGPIP